MIIYIPTHQSLGMANTLSADSEDLSRPSSEPRMRIIRLRRDYPTVSMVKKLGSWRLSKYEKWETTVTEALYFTELLGHLRLYEI